MKPFNLEKALAGYPVITRDGRKVLQIAYFGKTKDPCLIVQIEGRDNILLYSQPENGTRDKCGIECNSDLFMAPKKIKGYIAISNARPQYDTRHTSLFYKNKGNLEKETDMENYQIIEVEIDE